MLVSEKLNDLGHMLVDVLGQFIGRHIILIAPKRVFNFFSDQFQTSQHIKNKATTGTT